MEKAFPVFILRSVAYFHENCRGMYEPIINRAPTYLIALSLFLLIILFFWMGGVWRNYRMTRKESRGEDISGSLEGSMLGLLALLLAFTFGISNSRYDARRDILIREANSIGTVILRADLYPEPIRTELRKELKTYVDERIAYYKAGTKKDSVSASLARAVSISDRIWSKASSLVQKDSLTSRSTLFINALNDMIDLANTRDAMGRARVPASIIWMTILICMAVSFLLGYGMKGRKPDWMLVCTFSLIISLTVFLILDLDRPRTGMITMDSIHGKMEELRALFKP